jgi:hypothetical protein
MRETDRIGVPDTVALARQPKRGLMASHETEIAIYRAPAYAWPACQAAVKAGGWKVSQDADWRLVCTELWSPQLLMTSNPARIEIALYSAPQGSLVKMRGSNLGVGPIASNHVRGQVERLVGLLTSVLDSWAAASAPPAVGAPPAAGVPQNNRPVAVTKPGGFREVLAHNELVKLTGNWTTPVLIRQYDPGDRGLKRANTESNLLAAHGYRIAAQTDIDGHVNLGRLALTGGLGLLFGGTRSKGRLTITFEKSPAR